MPRVFILVAAGILMTPTSYGATIYRCKSYEGGVFWSSGPCSEHRALIDRMATVPDGMPFQQQVNVAEQALGNQQRAAKAEADEREKANKCYQIKAEFSEIWRKYENGKYVPPEQIGADQTRWKELQTLKARAGCPQD